MGNEEPLTQTEDVLFLLHADNGAHLSDRVMSFLLEECVMLLPHLPFLLALLLFCSPGDTDIEEEINVRTIRCLGLTWK